MWVTCDKCGDEFSVDDYPYHSPGDCLKKQEKARAQPLNKAIFEYLRDNMVITAEGDYGSSHKWVYLKLINPETGREETIGSTSFYIDVERE